MFTILVWRASLLKPSHAVLCFAFWDGTCLCVSVTIVSVENHGYIRRAGYGTASQPFGQFLQVAWKKNVHKTFFGLCTRQAIFSDWVPSLSSLSSPHETCPLCNTHDDFSSNISHGFWLFRMTTCLKTTFYESEWWVTKNMNLVLVFSTFYWFFSVLHKILLTEWDTVCNGICLSILWGLHVNSFYMML